MEQTQALTIIDRNQAEVETTDIITIASTFKIVVVTTIEAKRAKAMEGQATQMVEFAKKFEVDTALENQQAATLHGKWKDVAKQLDVERVTKKEDALRGTRSIDALYMPTIKLLKAAADEISRPMAAYDAKLEEDRRKEQARLDAIAEKERREREEKARLAQEKADEERRKAEAIRVEAERQRRILEEQAEEERRQTQAIQDKAERDKRILAAQVEQQRREAEIAKEEAESDKMLRQASRDEARADRHLEKAATTVAPVVREAPTPEGLSKVKVRTFDEAAIDIKELAQAALGGINVMIVEKDAEVAPGKVAYLLAGGKQLVVTSVPPRPELLNCLKVNTGKLRKLISAVEDTLTIPGVPITIETRFRSTKGTANV